jgi:hypothetical protein
VPAALDKSAGAGLVMIGGAASLPAGLRRRAGVERTHVLVGDPKAADVAGRVAEAALPPALVRELGAPPRTFGGRAAWREAAGHVAERDLGRDLGTGDDRATAALAEVRVAQAVRDLAVHRAPHRRRGAERSLEVG